MQNSFLRVRTKISRGPGALILKARRGSYDQSDFQPAAFVSSLQSVRSPKTRFDGHAAKFCRHLIFEFCNTIGGIADTANLWAIVAGHCGVTFSETPLDIRPYYSYDTILAPMKDMARRHTASWERGRCPRVGLQPAPGRLGHHVSRHYDRGGRCIPGLGQAKAGNARSDQVSGSLA